MVVSNFSRYVNGQGINAEEWRAGMHRTLVELRSSGAFVVILRDTPMPGFDVPSCLSRAAWRGKDIMSSCTFDRRRSLEADVFNIEQRVAETIDHVSVIDLSDLLCVGLTCQVYSGGRVARDAHHLTTAVSASLAPALLEKIDFTTIHLFSAKW